MEAKETWKWAERGRGMREKTAGEGVVQESPYRGDCFGWNADETPKLTLTPHSAEPDPPTPHLSPPLSPILLWVPSCLGIILESPLLFDPTRLYYFPFPITTIFKISTCLTAYSMLFVLERLFYVDLFFKAVDRFSIGKTVSPCPNSLHVVLKGTSLT